MCLENFRLQLTNDEVTGGGTDIQGPGNIEQHPLFHL